MADINADDNVRERYDEFIERLTQYMTTPIKDFPSIKPQILNILQTHRAIKTGDYQYCVSKAGKKKCQLIVHEFNQRSKVREYFKVGLNGWHCCECTRIGSTQTDRINDLVVAHGFVFVKLEHECQSRELSFVMEIQKFYKDGKLDEAAALQKSVLGTEDLNVISNKKVAVKREKKPPKSIKNIVENTSLQYAEENEELPPSIMDEQINEIQEIRPPEIVFAEIIENLEEYTYSKKDEILSKKSKILRVLKTQRPVKMVDYFYGMSFSLQSNSRLIVFEWNDRKRVRQYCRNLTKKYIWECRECHRMCDNGKLLVQRQYLNLVNGIVFIPVNHDVICKPRDYRLVMKLQKHLEEGDTSAAYSMTKTTDFTYGQNIQNLNFIDEKLSLNNPLTIRKRMNENQSDDKSCDKPPAHKKSKCNESALNDTVMVENECDLLKEDPTSCKKSKRKNATSDVLMDDTNMIENVGSEQQKKKSKRKKKRDVDEEIVSPDLHEPEAVNQVEEEKPESILTNSIFAFEKPSTLILEQICAKLNIQYRNRAMKIWGQIMFEQINTVLFPSTNIEVHEFQTENFYEILSKLFTGKSKHFEQIRTTIFEAFRNKLVESGEMSARKFDKYYSTDTVTDRHLCFIAKFLPCRILIFDGEESGIKKYGKWKETSRKRSTLILTFFDGIYSIVLNL